VKVPDFGPSASRSVTSKEEERAGRLAVRARNRDYSEGWHASSKLRTGNADAGSLDLIQEQLTRTSSFLTPNGLKKLRSAFVVVVGLGGVGSHCAAALARSGVSRIRIIDFDQVTLSSLNRHAVATLADVGTPKVSCVRKRLEAISPWVHWETNNEIWREDQAERLLGGSPDYVVDAIDNVDSKVALLRYCHNKGIKVISSMGAGCKSDPAKLFVDDISASTEDPLSASTRRRLRMEGIATGIPVVFSTEKPGPGKASLLPLPEDEFRKGKVGELSVLPDFRARILPVLGTMPAIFGYTAANWVILELAGYPHEIGAGKARDSMYTIVMKQVVSQEQRLVRSVGGDPTHLRLALTQDDIGYLLDEVYKGKSVISGLTTRLTLHRWEAPGDGSYPSRRDEAGQKVAELRTHDLVCMTREEATIHEQRVLLPRANPEDVYDAAVIGRVAVRLREERAYSRHREA